MNIFATTSCRYGSARLDSDGAHTMNPIDDADRAARAALRLPSSEYPRRKIAARVAITSSVRRFERDILVKHLHNHVRPSKRRACALVRSLVRTLARSLALDVQAAA